MVPGRNCPWWLESDDGGRAEFGGGLGRSGSGEVTVGETPAPDSMAAPQWMQNRLSCAISREHVGHLTMKGMLPENAEKIEAAGYQGTPPRGLTRCLVECLVRLVSEH